MPSLTIEFDESDTSPADYFLTGDVLRHEGVIWRAEMILPVRGSIKRAVFIELGNPTKDDLAAADARDRRRFGLP